MPLLPMFPLGSVLFPHMPLQLRVFEDRYIEMLGRILKLEPAEFGVVLIERGQEVGGGEQRFGVGTVAQVVEVDTAEGFVVLVALGERRIRVTEWLPEDPFPIAMVTELAALEWDERLQPLRQRAEHTVRRALAMAAEYGDASWSSDVELAADPIAAAWQLAAVAPLGELDQIALLRAETLESMLTMLIDFTEGAGEALQMALPE